MLEAISEETCRPIAADNLLRDNISNETDAAKSNQSNSEEIQSVRNTFPETAVVVNIHYLCEPQINATNSTIVRDNAISSEELVVDKNLEQPNKLSTVDSDKNIYSKEINHLRENECLKLATSNQNIAKAQTNTHLHKHLGEGFEIANLNLDKPISKSCATLDLAISGSSNEKNYLQTKLHAENNNNVNKISEEIPVLSSNSKESKTLKKLKQKRKYKELKKIFKNFLNDYQEYICKQNLLYQNCSPLLHRFYWHFKILELYTDFLKDLESFCKNTTQVPVVSTTTTTIMNPSSTIASSIDLTTNTVTTVTTTTMITSSSGVGHSSKKNCRQQTTGSGSRVDEEEVNVSANNRQARKLHRQEENYRHMLLPDTPEELNRKDSSKIIS